MAFVCKKKVAAPPSIEQADQVLLLLFSRSTLMIGNVPPGNRRRSIAIACLTALSSSHRGDLSVQIYDPNDFLSSLSLLNYGYPCSLYTPPKFKLGVKFPIGYT